MTNNKTELSTFIEDTFRSKWQRRKSENVPTSEKLRLSNDAIDIDGTVLYADLDFSTALVDNYNDYFAAEIYKNFLYCCAKIIRYHGGTITSYDGDRIMAIFVGRSKNSDAAKVALKINYIVKKMLNPALKKRYTKTSYTISHTVGIYTSMLMAARTGIRGNNDIVWVGKAANHAAKLTTISSKYPSYITKEVFARLNDQSKYGGNPKRQMWTKTTWQDETIYRSSWHWSV